MTPDILRQHPPHQPQHRENEDHLVTIRDILGIGIDEDAKDPSLSRHGYSHAAVPIATNKSKKNGGGGNNKGSDTTADFNETQPWPQSEPQKQSHHPISPLSRSSESPPPRSPTLRSPSRLPPPPPTDLPTKEFGGISTWKNKSTAATKDTTATTATTTAQTKHEKKQHTSGRPTRIPPPSVLPLPPRSRAKEPSPETTFSRRQLRRRASTGEVPENLQPFMAAIRNMNRDPLPPRRRTTATENRGDDEGNDNRRRISVDLKTFAWVPPPPPPPPPSRCPSRRCSTGGVGNTDESIGRSRDDYFCGVDYYIPPLKPSPTRENESESPRRQHQSFVHRTVRRPKIAATSETKNPPRLRGSAGTISTTSNTDSGGESSHGEETNENNKNAAQEKNDSASQQCVDPVPASVVVGTTTHQLELQQQPTRQHRQRKHLPSLPRQPRSTGQKEADVSTLRGKRVSREKGGDKNENAFKKTEEERSAVPSKNITDTLSSHDSVAASIRIEKSGKVERKFESSPPLRRASDNGNNQRNNDEEEMSVTNSAIKSEEDYVGRRWQGPKNKFNDDDTEKLRRTIDNFSQFLSLREPRDEEILRVAELGTPSSNDETTGGVVTIESTVQKTGGTGRRALRKNIRDSTTSNNAQVAPLFFINDPERSVPEDDQPIPAFVCMKTGWKKWKKKKQSGDDTSL